MSCATASSPFLAIKGPESRTPLAGSEGATARDLEAARISGDLARKNLEAEQRKDELGNEQIQFVLQARTDLAPAESGLVQADVGYQMAVAAAVEHASGARLDHQQVQISSLTR
ncbi:MAG: hypothetical protein ACLQOO_15945 [Terriglobia bacterium]